MDSRSARAWIVVLVICLSSLGGRATAAETIDPTGTWTWVRELEGQEAQSVLSLSYKNGRLTGSYKRQGQIVPISNAKLDKNEISFEADGKWNDQKVHGKFKGKLSAYEIHGSIEIVIEDGSLPLAWVAKRGFDADDVAGTWKLKVATRNGGTAESELRLSAEGGSIKGTYHSPRFGEHEVKEVKLNGRELSWDVELERDGQTFKAMYKGTLNGRSMKGSLTLDSGGDSPKLDFTGEQMPGGKVKSGSKPASEKSPAVESNR